MGQNPELSMTTKCDNLNKDGAPKISILPLIISAEEENLFRILQKLVYWDYPGFLRVSDKQSLTVSKSEKQISICPI